MIEESLNKNQSDNNYPSMRLKYKKKKMSTQQGRRLYLSTYICSFNTAHH